MGWNSKYYEKIAKSICDYYLNNREACAEQYEMAENRELSCIYESIKDENMIQRLFATVSTVIITANKYEKNILHANWHKLHQQKIKRIEINLMPQRENAKTTCAYYFCWYGYCILHIEAQYTGSYTLGGSADLVRYVQENPYLYPTTIVSLGICFGMNEDKQKLGDVILSDKIYPYFIGAKWGEKSFFVTDNNMFRVSDALRQRIKTEVVDLNLFNNLDFETYYGNYITGEAVISNAGARRQFRDITTQDIAAGEMEGYGLFKECCGKNGTIPCLIIKAICDWGVLKDPTTDPSVKQMLNNYNLEDGEVKTIKDRLQAYAAHNAFSVLDIILKTEAFSKSIYAQLKEFITNEHDNEERKERVIYRRSIKSFAEKNNGVTGEVIISDSYIDNMCQMMVQEGFLLPLREKVWKINL